jgi:hypothetical protein
MNISPRYSSRYPRQGKVAILCEGDLAGYEADLLEKWSASQSPPLFVDVWPCGTKTAIRGMADAIGRAVSFHVIEDRDYRTPENAREDCNALFKELREDRGTHVRSCRTWNRHEIENYFIEPEIIGPVLAQWFGATEADVINRLERVILSSAVDQAAQFTLSTLRASLPDPQKFVGGLSRAEARPMWTDSERCIVAPAREVVEEKVTEVIQASCKRFGEKSQRVDPALILNCFKTQADRWAGVRLSDDVWRSDWAGKEILQSLCRWLAGEFGWPLADGEGRERVNWSILTRQKRDEKEREIAVALEKDLTTAFLRYLVSGRAGDIRSEWDDIVKQVS